MDARIHASQAYGIDLGDAHIIRNAGASAKDALRSLVISEQLLGTDEILLIKHTGCGMLTFDNEAAEGIVKKNLGEEAVQELSAFNSDFLPFPELDKAVEDDVAFLKKSKLIPENVKISGWVYEVETGKVRKVV
jgi:carbonic anhydrase